MGFLWSQFFITPTSPTKQFTGQTIIVTGSNVGLGKEAARHFTRLDASKVILAVRNTTAGEEARTDILNTTKRPADTVEVWKLDLSSYDSVKAFAKRAEGLERIDVLLENAAIAAGEYNESEGYERSITVNVISTFLLAFLMVPKLKESAKKFGIQPHVSLVSSEVHAWTKFAEWKEDDIFRALNESGKKNMSERYPTSKLLEVLVVRAIAPKLEGTGIVMNYLNPGLCHSELGRDAGWGLTIMKFFLARTTEVGSRTLVAAASVGEESHGKYMTDGVVDEAALSPFVRSEEGDKAAAKVWSQLKSILERIEPSVTTGF